MCVSPPPTSPNKNKFEASALFQMFQVFLLLLLIKVNCEGSSLSLILTQTKSPLVKKWQTPWRLKNERKTQSHPTFLEVFLVFFEAFKPVLCSHVTNENSQNSIKNSTLLINYQYPPYHSMCTCSPVSCSIQCFPICNIVLSLFYLDF